MGEKIRVSEEMLYAIERYCNNYFNSRNDPSDSTRDYPPAFLKLAQKIEDYTEKIKKSPLTYESFGAQSYNVDLEYSAWQKAFAQELSIYKRVKFL